MFVTRYDLRCPAESPASRPDLYAAMLDHAVWAEAKGFDMFVLSEHHGVDDGYLPSPLIAAAAVAARTTRLPVNIAALLVNLHDPLRLAEDMAVLDLFSGGRVSYVVGLGYRTAEYEMFDKDWPGRGNLIEEVLSTLKQAWTGEPFEYHGRTVRVTPTPLSTGGPMLFYGGGSKAAARRAARLDMGFFPPHAHSDVQEAFEAEREKLGLGPGFVMAPPSGPGTVYVAEDPDAYWDEIGEHLLYEARVYHSWQDGVTSAVHDSSETVDEMKKAGVYVILRPDELIERCRSGEIGAVTTHPLCGGIPPASAQKSLDLLADVVMPAVRS